MLRLHRNLFGGIANMSMLLLCVSSFLAIAPMAGADEFAYEVDSTGQFGFIDLGTGVFTQLGSLSVTLCGLAVHKGRLYGYGPCATSGTLYEVNPTNGALKIIGTAPFNYRGLGSTTKGLYGFDPNMNLYSISPTTGSTTFIGATGLKNPSGFGVSDGLDTLYITPTPPNDENTPLYSVDTTNGTAIYIGLTGVYGIGALAVQDGKLYAGVFSPTTVYTLDTSTGAATFVADVTGTTSYFYGLAPSAQVAP
jgi:hypothetical protein